MSDKSVKSASAANVALGVVVGAAAGVAAGILLAPRSGKETREIIRDKAMDAKDMAEKKRDAALKVVSNTMDKSKDMIDRVSDRAKDAADQAKAETEAHRKA